MTSTNSVLQMLFARNSCHSLLKVLLFSTYFCTVINEAGADSNENPTHKVYITTGDRKSNGAAWSSINVSVSRPEMEIFNSFINFYLVSVPSHIFLCNLGVLAMIVLA